MQLPLRLPLATLADRVRALRTRLPWGGDRSFPGWDEQRSDDVRDALRRFGPIVGGALLVAFVLFTILPVNEWLAQRSALDGSADRLAELTAENAALDERIRALQSDEAIERIAREQYNLVMPGEEAYAILPTPPPEVRAETVLRVLDGAVFWR